MKPSFTQFTAASRLLSFKTLTLIRWFAIFGQLSTIFLVQWGFGFPLDLVSMGLLMGVAIVVNIIASIWWQRPSLERSPWSFFFFFVFDILHFSALLYLTGGIANPFCLLILAPTTVSALILPKRFIIALVILSLLMVTLLSLYHHPLPWKGEVPQFPLILRIGWWLSLCFALVLLAGYTWMVAVESHKRSDAMSALNMALEQEQQISRVGALTAAVVHELGTPLSTITVIAKELENSLPAEDPLMPDALLLSQEARTCQDILKKLGQGKLHNHALNRSLPVSQFLVSLIEALPPYPSKRLRLEQAISEGEEPRLLPLAELQHALKNLILNGLSFAMECVSVTFSWDKSFAYLLIQDDGKGFDEVILKNFGEPFLSLRHGSEETHLGLGIFIANTLLTHTGAHVSLRNEHGALCQIIWPRSAPIFIEDSHDRTSTI